MPHLPDEKEMSPSYSHSHTNIFQETLHRALTGAYQAQLCHMKVLTQENDGGRLQHSFMVLAAFCELTLAEGKTTNRSIKDSVNIGQKETGV